jgi:hypothetical protein
LVVHHNGQDYELRWSETSPRIPSKVHW